QRNEVKRPSESRQRSCRGARSRLRQDRCRDSDGRFTSLRWLPAWLGVRHRGCPRPGRAASIRPGDQQARSQHRSGKQPHWATTSSDGKTVYVTNEGSNDLTVVDLATGQTKTVAVGNAPRKVVVQPTAAATGS